MPKPEKVKVKKPKKIKGRKPKRTDAMRVSPVLGGDETGKKKKSRRQIFREQLIADHIRKKKQRHGTKTLA